MNSKSDAFTAIGTNYINFFKNYDGTASIGSPKGLPNAESNPQGGTQVSTSQAFSNEWTHIVESVTIEAGEYLVFDACAVETGVMLTGFEIYEVQEIYDTRILERTVDYINKLLALQKEKINWQEFLKFCRVCLQLHQVLKTRTQQLKWLTLL